SSTGLVQFRSQLLAHLDKTAREVLLLDRCLILLLLLWAGLLAGGEETRLSRSTYTPKCAWMRSMIFETCSGERALQSMSKAMST
ncbi:MAG: hypothetical protein ACYDBH_23535, partial [Acidobacteriaceae bacterium]